MAVGQPAPTLKSGKVDAPEQFVIFKTSKRLVGLICWRIIMNCPACNSSKLYTFILKNFENTFNSYFNLDDTDLCDNTLNYHSIAISIGRVLHHLTFSYRNQSLEDIAEETDTCVCSVIAAFSALESNSYQLNQQLINNKSLHRKPISDTPLTFIQSDKLNQLKANAIFESYDFAGCLNLRDLLSEAELSFDDFIVLLKTHFEIDLDIITSEDEDDYFKVLIEEMMNSESRCKYEEQRRFYYSYDELIDAEKRFYP
ncbi:hypothetical protein B5G52_09490 [Pseudoalteromonas sp. A601]|uniref:hypothetical protein n=1 Tax=Pseudoalteromonas sp. A601 TaxID=1967839 RepID=UPI000B3C6058|nr:hypothetical protein [Pseudoalteromonas sp. A601]OUS72076.1 hypothetical protein B5G52_09490 [Pseudoalteromonas sp. A601]